MSWLKQNWLKISFATILISFSRISHAFVQSYNINSWDPPGLFSGIWHGLLAPWSLIARWIISDVVMYAVPNTGWLYDFGFLVGIIGSIPIGWAAAILSLLFHFLGL